MFRIDRRFVKLTGIQVSRAQTSVKKEVDAEGENPEAAASVSIDPGNTEGESPEAAASLDMPDMEDEGEGAERGDSEDAGSAGGVEDAGGAGGVEGAGGAGGAGGVEDAGGADTEDSEEDSADSEEMIRFYMSAAEKELEERAQVVMNDAREKAAAIVAEAQEQAENERKRGYEEGFAEGSLEGKQVYEQKLEEQRQEDEKALKNVLDEIAREREQQNSRLESDTAALAVEIVRKIFSPPQEGLDDAFMLLVKNTFKQMSADSKFVIRVAPGEFERFFPGGSAEIELEGGKVIKASVIRDAALEDGDLVIDADDITVNAGLESQLKYVELAFEEAGNMETEV